MTDEQNVDQIIAEAIGRSAHSARVVTFGEAYLILESDGRDRLERAHTAHISVGGPELNVAAALACLGVEASWVSTVSNSAFGRRMLRAARAANVDTQWVETKEGRTGLKFVDPGVEPRETSILIDTGNSAFARRKSGRYDWDAILDGVDALYISGSTLGVSPSVRNDAIDAMTVANAHGLIVAFELRYRPDGWTEAEARRTFSGIVRHTDVLFTDRANLEMFFGIDGAYDFTMRQALERLGVAAVAMRRDRNRGNGRIALEGLAMGKSGSMVISNSHTVEVVDAGGAGDAFAAGFLSAYVENPSAISKSTSLGAATSAMSYTMHGEMLIASKEEIEALAEA